VFCLFTTTNPLHSQWITNGPSGGNVSCFAVSGTNLFAGIFPGSGGVFLSTDNGKSWTRVNTGLQRDSVLALAVSGMNLFAANGGGVSLSTNNGTSWNAVNTGMTSSIVYALAVSGTNLFAGTINGSGVFLSTNDGTSWTAKNTGLTDHNVSTLAISGTNLFAGTENGGVFLSTNSGTSWTAVNTGLTNTSVVSLAVSGTNLFAGTFNGGVFLSTNNGTSWTAASTGLANNYVYALAVSGSNLFAGTLGGVFLSTNNGTSWAAASTGLTNNYIYALAVSGTNLFAGTNGSGVWQTSLSFFSVPSIPILNSPLNGSLNQPLSPIFYWSRDTATFNYHLQVSKDSAFSLIVYDDSTITTNSNQVDSLQSNTVYYWRVKGQNFLGSTQWTSTWHFTTYTLPPSNLSPQAGNRKITLTWLASASQGIYKYKIYRGTSSPTLTIHDSTTTTSYVDTGLTNGAQYFYGVTTENDLYLEGPFSSEINATPFNKPPHAAVLQSAYEPNAGSVPLALLNFSSVGSNDSDGTVDSIFWFVDGNLVSKQHQLAYNFGQGTNQVKLVVQDNQGARDSSLATVNRSKFKFQMNGPAYAGPSLLGNNILYVIGTGDAVYRLDSTGNALYSLEVGGDVKSSSSISSDTTVYIASSDKNLYAFSKFGISLWPALPLGGTMTSTPAVDSITDCIYVGVSNKNFFAVRRTTGTVVWNYFVDAPIVGSAAITLDRKLVVATVKGTVYGFDLNALSSAPAPSWQISLSDSIFGSPAIDASGNIYYCTGSGKVDKITMPPNQQASTVWQTQVGGSINGSPVIDGIGMLYIGCMDAKLYAIDIQSGNIKWSYPSGAPIFSTPAVSDINMIYFGNHGGEVFAIDTNKVLHWYYQDSTSVDAPLLYSNGVLYAGTIGGRLIAFYDNADSSVRGSSKAAQLSKANSMPRSPVWGTFQGNNQRTGSPVGKIITEVTNQTNQIPDKFNLSQNYPNPFNPTTTILYSIPHQAPVKIIVYDMLGRIVATLVNEQKAAGEYSISFDASKFASGVYLYRMQAGSFTATEKLILIR